MAPAVKRCCLILATTVWMALPAHAQQRPANTEIDGRIAMFELQRNAAMNVVVMQNGTIERLKAELHQALDKAKEAACKPEPK